MTHTGWAKTLRAKVQTSWNLHSLLPKNMDFFILLSSVSGIIGNAGQANYAAGCTFQDRLALSRRSQGQKAISIDLGVVRGVGVVAESAHLQQRLTASLGKAVEIDENDVLAALDIYCDPLSPSSDSGSIVMGIDGSAGHLGSGLEPPAFMRQPLFSHLNSHNKHGRGEEQKVDHAVSFRQAKTKEEKSAIVLESLIVKLSRALSIKPEDIDVHQPLHAFGVDSLVAVEIRTWIGHQYAADVAIFELIGGRTLPAICDLVSSRGG